MWLLVIGGLLVALGSLGILLAPAMIDARREAGMLDDDSDITDDDRILATRGMGGVFVVVGILLIGYQIA